MYFIVSQFLKGSINYLPDRRYFDVDPPQPGAFAPVKAKQT